MKHIFFLKSGIENSIVLYILLFLACLNFSGRGPVIFFFFCLWECVLNKRLDFEVAFDYFDIDKICEYDEVKITELLTNPRLIRNKLKMKAVVNNAKIYRGIVKSFGSFDVYLKSFAGDKVIYEVGPTTSPLSDKISADLKSRGMKFVGSTTVYSFLQAIGIIYAHDENCYKYRKN